MATYWFVIGWFDNQSVQKSEVRQAAKDVKSEVHCYENPKQEKVSHAFKHLMQNLKAYNGVGV